MGRRLRPFRMSIAAVCLGAVFYVTSMQLAGMFWRPLPLPEWPERVLDPFRIANQYGLFAVMTHARYEIEFQGTRDGKSWNAYPFRYKPQDLRKPPGIYAPYQPRFDWNLWFASLGPWQDYRFVVWTEERLLQNDRTCCNFSPGTRLTARRRGKCARSSISIGSRTVRQSAKPEIGGDGKHSASMHRHSSAGRMGRW